jgi:hypothetical protein
MVVLAVLEEERRVLVELQQLVVLAFLVKETKAETGLTLAEIKLVAVEAELALQELMAMLEVVVKEEQELHPQ